MVSSWKHLVNLWILVLFPNATEPSKRNGGACGQWDFRDLTLDHLVEANKNMEVTLIARSSLVKWRDNEGVNLHCAIPL